MLIVTTSDDDELVYASLGAGAGGFLLKDAPPREPTDGLRAVAQGQSLLASRVARRMIERFVARRPTDPGLRRQAATPSEREQEVLRLLARGLRNADIGERPFAG